MFRGHPDGTYRSAHNMNAYCTLYPLFPTWLVSEVTERLPPPSPHAARPFGSSADVAIRTSLRVPTRGSS
jgi:hypothetical protein